MKKISVMLVLSLSTMLIACDGSKKAPESPETTPTEAAAPETPEVSAEDTMSVSAALAKYEETVKKLIPSLLAMQKGDTKAIKEYQSLNKEINKLAPILSKKAGEMTEKEAKKYKEIADKLYQATNPNAKPAEKKK